MLEEFIVGMAFRKGLYRRTLEGRNDGCGASQELVQMHETAMVNRYKTHTLPPREGQGQHPPQHNQQERVLSRFSGLTLPHQNPRPHINAHQQLMQAKEQDRPFTHHAPHQIPYQEDRESAQASYNGTHLILIQRIGGHDRQDSRGGNEAGSDEIDHFNQLGGDQFPKGKILRVEAGVSHRFHSRWTQDLLTYGALRRRGVIFRETLWAFHRHSLRTVGSRINEGTSCSLSDFRVGGESRQKGG